MTKYCITTAQPRFISWQAIIFLFFILLLGQAQAAPVATEASADKITETNSKVSTAMTSTLETLATLAKIRDEL
ncbi:MAG: hypothetical protein QNL62_09415, partial [Gammaproteobacteria bacterium]|nr:hypothetical protein [Gammaproteobacteria bacterium]